MSSWAQISPPTGQPVCPLSLSEQRSRRYVPMTYSVNSLFAKYCYAKDPSVHPRNVQSFNTIWTTLRLYIRQLLHYVFVSRYSMFNVRGIKDILILRVANLWVILSGIKAGDMSRDWDDTVNNKRYSTVSKSWSVQIKRGAPYTPLPRGNHSWAWKPACRSLLFKHHHNKR